MQETQSLPPVEGKSVLKPGEIYLLAGHNKTNYEEMLEKSGDIVELLGNFQAQLNNDLSTINSHIEFVKSFYINEKLTTAQKAKKKLDLVPTLIATIRVQKKSIESFLELLEEQAQTLSKPLTEELIEIVNRDLAIN